MNRSVPPATTDVVVTVHRRLPGAEEYAVQRVEHALRIAPEPVHGAKVRLTRHENPAMERPVVAQVNVDLRGRLVRAQASAGTATEAIDLLHDRLRKRVERASRNWEALRGRVPTGEGWRHGQLPASHPDHFPRPKDERQVLRHKAFNLSRCSVAEAAAEMDELDYSFHLFTDVESGADRVVFRTDGEVDVMDNPPRMSLSQAVERIEISGEPFVFFSDLDLARGCVLYHRYNGHYGLITPGP